MHSVSGILAHEACACMANVRKKAPNAFSEIKTACTCRSYDYNLLYFTYSMARRQPGCSRIHSQAYLLEEGGIELAFGTEGGGLEGECLLSLRIEGRVLDERVDEYPAESNELIS